MQVARACSNRVWLAVILLAALPVQAESTLSGSINLASEYVFRGLSMSGQHAAVQGDLHWRNSGGAVAGIWASQSQRLTNYYSSTEIDAYLGQSLRIAGPWTAQFGYVHYAYPAGRRYVDYDYDEVHTAIGYADRLSVSIAYSPDIALLTPRGPLKHNRWFAYQLNVRQSLPLAFALTAGIGDYVLRGVHDFSYLAWSIGVEWQAGALSVATAYIGVDKSGRRWFGDYAADGRILANASWRF